MIQERNNLMKMVYMRHWKVLLVITMQYPLGIPPSLRTNVDYLFILRENILNNRRRIYENYASMFPTFEAFCSDLDSCTENYECLVIDNNSKSNRLRDQIFWYRTDTHGDFKLGSKEFWDLSKDLLSEDEDEYDPNKNRKTNNSRIVVKKVR